MADYESRIAGSGSQTVALDKSIAEISKKLKSFPEKIRNKHLRATVREGAKVVLYAAIHNVEHLPEPESGIKLRTGRIARKLGIAVSKGRKYSLYDYKARIGVRNTSLVNGERSPDSAFYWHYVEFGTPKMGARPFLRPAFEDNRGQILNIMERRLKKAIEIEAAKGR